MNQKKVVTFVAPTLGLGGAERVLTTMASHWSAKKWQITIITLDAENGRRFYSLDPNISIRRLGVACSSVNWLHGMLNNLKRLMVLRDAIILSKAKVVISVIDTTNVLTLLATLGTSIPVIVSEHSDPWKWNIGAIWKGLRNLCYRWASQIIVQGAYAKSYFPPAIASRISIIPNPVTLDGASSASTLRLERPTIMVMGRLSQEKAFDAAIRAFAEVHPKFSHWNLAVVGDGPLREELKSLCKQLMVEHRVRFTGVVTPSEPVLRQADIFVLSSKIEGFPMVLCEAMFCGVPVIATEYSRGVHELVSHGHDGLVVSVDDVPGLAQAMERLMCDDLYREQLGRNAKDLKSICSVEVVMRQWEEVIEGVVK